MRTWRWARMARATKHRERLQTRCNHQPASVWGTASTDGSPWRWDTSERALTGAIIAKMRLHPSALLLCSSPPPPLSFGLMGDLIREEAWGEVHLLMGSQCHDTDSSPAPGGPQQWLAKRCSVIICPVTTVIFYTVCRLSRDGSDSPLFLLKGCI